MTGGSSTPGSSAETPKPPRSPAIVIGPDGKPCKTCTAARFWKPAARAATRASSPAAAPVAQDVDARPDSCPPDVEQLGRATWAFLHTTAAYYPDKPTVHQRVSMLSLLHALPTLYPCSHCASHLGDEMKRHPPDVSGRQALSWWLCQRHNEVNERLGKEKFDCTKTDERWKDGPTDRGRD